MAMELVAEHLRALQLYAHHAHNNCSGKTFFQDHEFFGDVYTAAETAYDSVVERMIGLTHKPVDTITLTGQAAHTALQLGRDAGECNSNFFTSILRLELTICVLVDKCCAGDTYPEGVKQLLGDIADKSMVRQYKIRQRLQG